MATSDDPVANWQQRIGTLRKRGRISSAAALTVVPPDESHGREARRRQRSEMRHGQQRKATGRRSRIFKEWVSEIGIADKGAAAMDMGDLGIRKSGRRSASRTVPDDRLRPISLLRLGLLGN
jgi:hypothetical protein